MRKIQSRGATGVDKGNSWKLFSRVEVMVMQQENWGAHTFTFRNGDRAMRQFDSRKVLPNRKGLSFWYAGVSLFGEQAIVRS